MSAECQHVTPTVVAEGDQVVVTVPLRTKRRRGRKEIIVPEGLGPDPVEVRTNEPLALTIARAHRWRELLDSGRVGTLRGLAQELEVSHAYLSRLLRLTLLAPDLVEAILEGTEPSGLSIAQLAALPLEWEGQREAVEEQAGPWRDHD